MYIHCIYFGPFKGSLRSCPNGVESATSNVPLPTPRFSHNCLAICVSIMEHKKPVDPNGSMDKLDSLSVKDPSVKLEQDPFGDESQTGVKYKTMAWW